MTVAMIRLPSYRGTSRIIPHKQLVVNSADDVSRRKRRRRLEGIGLTANGLSLIMKVESEMSRQMLHVQNM